MSLKTLISKVNRRNLTSNTQKVALRLLSADGSWVSRKELERYVSSAPSRVRDLRKPEFGSFEVECASAASLSKKGDKSSFFYRIRPASVTGTQIATVFRV